MKKPTNLNDAQWQAVISPARRLLIVAGPGTGKTHTLTSRIAYQARALPPGRKMLAITFTHKAAGEMRQRLERLIPDVAGRVETGTFHQFCLSVLRDHFRQAGLSADFRIVIPQELEHLAREYWPGKNMRDIRMALHKFAWLKTVEFGGDWPPEFQGFHDFLNQKQCLDFDDLLRRTYDLLCRDSKVLADCRSIYQDIFVDEYQDLNPIQHALVKVLVGTDGRITAIGDPQQAIYGFRGADAGFFECFKEDYAPAQTLVLDHNYRSAHNLLTAYGQVISRAGRIMVPDLTATVYEQGRLVVHESATDKAEAEFVVHEIEKLIGGVGMFSQDSGRLEAEDVGDYGFGDIAVFFRLNSQAREIKRAFDRLGVPYRWSGEQQHAQDMAEELYEPGIPEPEIDGQRVNLLTLHAAKGLEFPVVFIVGCEAGLIPLDFEGFVSDPLEERRLFYVGMSRAKERLYLVSSKKRFLYGKTIQARPSPFVADIDQQLKEVIHSRYKKNPKPAKQQLNLFK